MVGHDARAVQRMGLPPAQRLAMIISIGSLFAEAVDLGGSSSLYLLVGVADQQVRGASPPTARHARAAGRDPPGPTEPDPLWRRTSKLSPTSSTGTLTSHPAIAAGRSGMGVAARAQQHP
jgi:hypothetical protein